MCERKSESSKTGDYKQRYLFVLYVKYSRKWYVLIGNWHMSLRFPAFLKKYQ